MSGWVVGWTDGWLAGLGERDYSRSSMNGGRLDSRSGYDRFGVYANIGI